MRIPRELSPLEEKIKRLLKKRLGRGRVDFVLNYQALEELPVVFTPKIELARNYLDAVWKLADGIERQPELDLKDVLYLLKDVIVAQEEDMDTELVWQRISPVLEDLLESALEMARREGQATEKDIRNHLSRIQELAADISLRARKNTEIQANAMRERIAALLRDVPLDEARIAQEAAILADRLDINEELVRLESHISQFYKYLEAGEDVGRKLDFLVQEIFREANTMTSKSADTTISHLVVEIKAELEKIREQLQNVV